MTTARRAPGALVAVLVAVGAAFGLWLVTGSEVGAAPSQGEPSEDPSEPGTQDGRPSPAAPDLDDTTADELLGDGRELYLTGCSSCHGVDGRGVVEDEEGNFRGPSLVDSGEASAFYYLSTGRMPLANSDDQSQRKAPAYSPEQIDTLVAYVAALGDGPSLPELDLDDADVAEGGVLYRSNCQACHSASGVGGALSYGSAAPNIHPAEPLEIAAAVRSGPGEMPEFGTVFDDEELDDLVAYVQYLDQPEDVGGLSLGRVGPIPEGFVTWVVGIGALLGMVVWIGKLRREGELSS